MLPSQSRTPPTLTHWSALDPQEFTSFRVPGGHGALPPFIIRTTSSRVALKQDLSFVLGS